MRFQIDKIALISDVHGNMPALDIVLADIKRRGIDLIYNLGDLVGKGPSSPATLDLCREVCQVIVRGNWDDAIVKNEESPAAAWYRAQLGAERLAYLRDLPNSYDFRLSGKHVRLYHASAQSEHHRVHPNSGDAELQAMFDNTPFTGLDQPLPDVAGYGDIHGAYLLPVEIGDTTKTLFNVGSVGNPLDCTLATYVILTGMLDSAAPAPLCIDFVRLPYDIDAAIAQSNQTQQPDFDAYNEELRTGIYRHARKKSS
ncbi:metallophosphoesterase family protein [Candidatus Flexifilum breve]|uniref:metallophosphoesterase family protein n=1 Tax=Candidatus Flexifilum breve TaxID=3140694 RepID=UPI0031CC5E75